MYLLRILLPEFSRYNNDSWFKLTGQNVSFLKNSGIWLQNPKKHYFDPMVTSAKYFFWWFWSQIQEFFKKTNLSGLLTFCPVNLNHVSLLNLENSGRRILRRYILKKQFRYFCNHVSDWTSHPSLSIFFRMQDFCLNIS
jgi:hypothetical protein